MRYAICKTGESVIFQIMEVPQPLINECTPAGFYATPIDVGVSDTTHIILDGKAVLKPQE